MWFDIIKITEREKRIASKSPVWQKETQDIARQSAREYGLRRDGTNLYFKGTNILAGVVKNLKLKLKSDESEHKERNFKLYSTLFPRLQKLGFRFKNYYDSLDWYNDINLLYKDTSIFSAKELIFVPFGDLKALKDVLDEYGIEAEQINATRVDFTRPSFKGGPFGGLVGKIIRRDKRIKVRFLVSAMKVRKEFEAPITEAEKLIDEIINWQEQSVKADKRAMEFVESIVNSNDQLSIEGSKVVVEASSGKTYYVDLDDPNISDPSADRLCIVDQDNNRYCIMTTNKEMPLKDFVGTAILMLMDDENPAYSDVILDA